MGVLSCCGHRLFDIFEELAGIPHGSGNTDRISSWCEQFAKAHGLRCVKDDHNNVIIFRPGSRGHEDCAPVILQAHLDMVCVHEDGYEIDMARQPVRLVTDGRTIRAYRTSLGADNLIGVSIILALLTDESLVHPPIEAVLTSDEETGMHGARALDYSLLKGKMVINLDSGSDGHFNVCCSGGLQTVSTLPIRRKPLGDGLTAVRVSISGLAGGHSANRINRCGANANVLIAEMIFSLSKRIPIHLCALEGGSAENVIAFSSSAVLAFPSNMENAFDGQLKALSDGIRQRFLKTDPMMEITVKRTDVPEQGVEPASTEAIASLISGLPYGVISYDRHFEGLPETSLNLGILRLSEDSLEYHHYLRSSSSADIEGLFRTLEDGITRRGGQIRSFGGYPEWRYREDSPLRDILLGAYRDVSGKEASIKGTHGGLECGVFCSNIPDADIVSANPDLRDVHSVNEHLDVETSKRLYDVLRLTLKRISEAGTGR